MDNSQVILGNTPEKNSSFAAWKEAKLPKGISSYHQLWDYTTNSIQIPDKNVNDPPTSLEILERIIKTTTIDIKNYTNVDVTSLPECFIPRVDKTLELVDCGQTLGFPILNMGFPKSGSTALSDFFKCSSYDSAHGMEGQCIGRALHEKQEPPISGCYKSKNKQVLLQLDYELKPHGGHTECWFPQISFLDEIHKEYPNATFILVFRPINDWIISARNHMGMLGRFKKDVCRKNVPGLIMNGTKWTHKELYFWWCTHITHIREFVQQYPSHKLIEVNLYDSEKTSTILATLFNSTKTCWKKSNSNENKTRKFKGGESTT